MPPELDFKRWQLSQNTLPQTRAGETWKHRVSNVTSTESQTSQGESQTPALLTVGYRLQGRNHFLDTHCSRMSGEMEYESWLISRILGEPASP